MRGLAYAIAAIAAVGIMITIAKLPGTQSEPSPAPVPATVVSTGVTTEAGKMTLDVPKMHCEFSCFPQVKKTIEGLDGVQGVELAEQKEEGVIDNRQVIVNFDAGFDIDAAIASLADKGFDESVVAQ